MFQLMLTFDGRGKHGCKEGETRMAIGQLEMKPRELPAVVERTRGEAAADDG